MPLKPSWSLKDLKAVASQYTSRSAFQKGAKGAYLSAMRRGLLDEICQHMELTLVSWTLEKCREEAKKYKSRTEFQKGSGSAYNAALREDWLDDICKHMIKGADGYHYMVYGILNKRMKKAYVGITKQQFNQRMKSHKEGGTTRASEISKLNDTEFISLTDYTLLSTEIKEAEERWATHFADQGYQILNSEKMFGKVGVSKRIYSDEIILKEAKKYLSRSEFKSKSPRHYDAACTQKILNLVCSHMRSIRPNKYWTKDRCIEAASKCDDRSEFVNHQKPAYEAAKRNGWLEEIWDAASLRSRMEMTWLRPSARKDIWLRADSYYELWVENQCCGMWRMRTITGINLDKLIKKFRKGWIPSNDKDWISWKNTFDSDD